MKEKFTIDQIHHRWNWFLDLNPFFRNQNYIRPRWRQPVVWLAQTFEINISAWDFLSNDYLWNSDTIINVAIDYLKAEGRLIGVESGRREDGLERRLELEL